MESNYSLGCFQWFSYRTLLDAILITSIPLKIYGTPESFLLQADHSSEHFILSTSVLQFPRGKGSETDSRFQSGVLVVLLVPPLTD